MSAIETLLAKPVIQALGWALVHFIWQGAIIAALYGSVKILLRKRAANVRYAAACSALALMLAAPLISLFVMSRSPASAQSIGASGPVIAPALGPDAQPGPATKSARQGVFESPAQEPSVPLKRWASERFASCLPWLLALWAAGVLLFSLRFAGGLVMAHRLRRRDTGPMLEQWQEKIHDLAKRLRVSRPVRLYESLVVEVPTVIGWLRPVILLPASAVTGLSAAQIEALIAHELAHVRRYDYLINLLQTSIETVLFYHPAVWWVSGEIREEREHCCDDLAVAACGNVAIYARALAELEQLRVAAPRLAVAANGGSLLRRIQRLIERPARAPHRFESGITGAIAIATILFLLASAHALLSESSLADAGGSVAMASETRSGSSESKSPVGESVDQRPAQRIESAPPQPAPGDDTAESIEPDAERPVAAGEEAAPGNEQEGGSSGSQDFIGSMRALGYTTLSDAELNALDAHGITPDFVAEINAALNARLSPSQLVALRVHGVTAGLIEELDRAGLANLTADQLVASRVHGVTPQFISELKALGYDGLSADALVAFRVHGVTPEFIRAINELGYDRVSAGELTALKIHGATPEFIRSMKGYVRGDLSVGQLTALRIHGATEGFIRELNALGYSDLSADQLTAARIHGVTPKFIAAIRSFNFKPTFDQLLQLRINRVTTEFVERVRSQGFNDVTIDQLIELRLMNIIPGSRNK